AHLDVHADHWKPLLARLVHNAATDANVVNADDLRTGSVSADVADGLRRGRLRPCFERMHEAARNDAANTLGVSVPRNVHPGHFAPAWSHLVPPLLRRLDPRQRHPRVVARRRALPKHHRVPPRRIFAPFLPPFLDRLTGYEPGDDLAAFLHVRRVEGADRVR